MQKVKEDAVNKYLLHKQHLLETSLAASVIEVVDDIIGLHATSATTPYLSLFARMIQFQRSALDQELYVNRTLIRIGAMRRTLFIMSTKLAPIAFQATRMPEDQIKQLLEGWRMPYSEYQRIADSVYDVLQEGPKPLRLIKQAMTPGLVRSIERPSGRTVSRMTNVNITLTVLMQQGKIFSEKFADPILTQHANRYALLRTVYPTLNLESLSPEDALVQLIKRYISTFGPVTEQDITWWTGLSKTAIQTALSALESELLSIQIKKHSHEYIMLESDYKALKKFKAPRSLPPLLLPYEDPYTKGYLLRKRLVKAEHEKHVYIGGEAQPTVLVNGKIVGIWNRVFEKPGDTITIQLFQRIGRSDKNTLLAKAHAMSHMLTGKERQVVIKTNT